MMNVNHLPARTWEWLRVNEAAIKDVIGSGAFEYKEKLPDGVSRRGLHNTDTYAEDSSKASGKDSRTEPGTDSRTAPGKDYRTALGKEFDEALGKLDLPVSIYKTAAGDRTPKTVYQDFDITGADNAASLLFFDIAEGSSCTVIQIVESGNASSGDPASAASGDKNSVDITSHFIIQNKFHVHKNADLTLIQVQNIGSGSLFLNDCGGICDEGASFHKIQLILNGGVTYTGDFCSLSGDKSSYQCNLGYRLEGDHRLDMNYVADHTGKVSESKINVSGVMSGTSNKLFRGTIDFHKGCAGSKGAELEEVLLLDDTIVNKTVPLILCDEEDVEGSHGATIGQLDENLMFYLKSRGIEEEEIYSMMAQARVDAVAELIPDMAVRDRVLEMADGPIERDCLKR